MPIIDIKFLGKVSGFKCDYCDADGSHVELEQATLETGKVATRCVDDVACDARWHRIEIAKEREEALRLREKT